MLQDNQYHVDTELLAQYHTEQTAARPAPTDWAEVWRVVRPLLLVWAWAIWGLIIALPSVELVKDIHSAFLHLPYPLVGIVLVGGMSLSLKWSGKQNAYASDTRYIVFLAALLSLAGWM